MQVVLPAQVENNPECWRRISDKGERVAEQKHHESMGTPLHVLREQCLEEVFSALALECHGLRRQKVLDVLERYI